MRNFVVEHKFEGRYVEQFANGREKVHRGNYFVTELKTRYLVTFKPFGYAFPLFVDFCILKKRNMGIDVVINYINENWN